MSSELMCKKPKLWRKMSEFYWISIKGFLYHIPLQIEGNGYSTNI